MRRTYAGLFLISLTALLVELLLTRIFDVILMGNLAFMIISCAIFGLGLGGLWATLVPCAPGEAPTPSLATTALLFAASVWALPLLLNVIPFSFDQVGRHTMFQLACFLLLYLVLLAPFFFAGLCVSRIFSSAPRHIQRLYFWDLSGAALGSAILIPLMAPLGPSWLLVTVAVAALTAAVLFSTARPSPAFLVIAAVFVTAPVALGPRYLTLALHDNKRDTLQAIQQGRLEFSKWDPVSKIEILDRPARTSSPEDHGRKHIAYDGGTLSSDFYPFDGDYAALRENLPTRLRFHFWNRSVLASHYLRRDTGHTVLIIGSAGGQETKAALMYGASRVDAVEMVRTVVELGTGRYARYIGGLYEDPRVHLHVGEGRSFLRASRQTYDVIQIFSNYTTASIASGSGSLRADYLQTADAYAEFYTHLAPDGILHINHEAYPRMIATAAAAWQSLGRRDFRSHVLVFETAGPDPDYLPAMLIKMTPWTPAEIADAQAFYSTPIVGEGRYALVENPLDRAHSFLPDAFYSGELPSSLLANAPYDASAVTDDRPSFRFMRRSISRVEPSQPSGLNYSTASILNAQLRGGWVPMDWIHLIGASAASVFYGLLFVLAPMLTSRVGRGRWSGKMPALTYFSLLGAAFIAIELIFIQIFMKLIGYPLYAVTVVIGVMLFGAAMGSLTSQTLAGRDGARWYVAFVGVLVTGLTIWLTYEPVSTLFIASHLALRVTVAATMILPMAYFMGMPFPLGILELDSKPRGAVAWAWSMNGLFTTIGGVATTVASLWFGFRETFLAALAVYALSSVAFAALRQANRQPIVEEARTQQPLLGPRDIAPRPVM